MDNAKNNANKQFGKYLVLDIETTDSLQKVGNPTGKILQISAIIDDYQTKLPFEQLPKLDIIVKYNWPATPMTISPEAILMNQRIFNLHKEENKLARSLNFNRNDPKYIEFAQQHGFMVKDKICYENNVVQILEDFLLENGLKYGIIVAGKNFGSFDLQYLRTLPNWEKAKFSFTARQIDPAILYFNPKIDKTLPDLKTCKERAGISGEVSHNALEDCWDTVRIIRYALEGCENLFIDDEEYLEPETN